MQHAAGHIAIVAGAGLGAYVLSLAVSPDRQGATRSAEEAAVIVTLPQRPSEPVVNSPRPQQYPGAAPPAGDRGSVTRQLQTELKRVGCYDGEVNGVWTTSSRLAMRNFTDLVNAKLPIDKPDHILLALVQGRQDRVCGVAQTAQRKALDKPEAGEPIPARAPSPPVAASPVVAVPAPKLIAPPTEAVRPTASRRADQKQPPPKDDPQPTPAATQPPEPVPAERPPRAAPAEGPIPPVGVYEQRPRQPSQLSPSQQIAYARSLLRSFKKAVTTALPLP
jgi:hypothetical protein